MWVFFTASDSWADTKWCPTIQFNSNSIYMDIALGPTGWGLSHTGMSPASDPVTCSRAWLVFLTDSLLIRILITPSGSNYVLKQIMTWHSRSTYVYWFIIRSIIKYTDVHPVEAIGKGTWGGAWSSCVFCLVTPSASLYIQPAGSFANPFL